MWLLFNFHFWYYKIHYEIICYNRTITNLRQQSHNGIVFKYEYKKKCGYRQSTFQYPTHKSASILNIWRDGCK